MRMAAHRMEHVPEHIHKIWQNIVNIVADTCGVPVCLVTRFDPPEVECVSVNRSGTGYYAPGDRWALNETFCGSVFESKRRVMVSGEERTAPGTGRRRVRDGMVSYLGYPLFYGDGRIFGTLCVFDSGVIRAGNRFDAIMKECKAMIEEHLKL